MPSIGWGEMLMLAVVAIVVVGPKELPRLMRVAGHWMGKARAAAREFQQAFDDLARESEVEEMRRKMDDLRSQSMFPDIDTGIDEESASATASRGTGGNGAGKSETSEPKTDPRPRGETPSSGSEEKQAGETPESRTVPSH